MKATFAVCLLVFAITGSECGPEKRQLPEYCMDAAQPGSDLATCILDYASSPTSICTGSCRSTLERYANECLLAAEQYIATLDQICDSTPEAPGGGGSAFCAGSDLATCIADFASSPSSVCSGSCRSTLERYADECLTVGAEQYIDTLDQVCDSTPEAPGGGGSAFCAGSDLATCIADYASSPSSVCSGSCRSTLERYADDCLTVGAGQYIDTLDQVCDDTTGGGGNSGNESDATTATATLASTITALVVAVAAALN